jgi:hypothetical protein
MGYFQVAPLGAGSPSGAPFLPFGVTLQPTTPRTEVLPMNKSASGRVGGRSSEQQVPPLRYAPVGMTIHL